MERLVKERLVGAAVLMAAAIILIPEMLSGPDRAGSQAEPAAAPKRSDAPIKTYTIDLSQSPTAAPGAVVENRAPPPEVVPTTPQPPQAQPSQGDQAKPEVAQQSAATMPQSQPVSPPAVVEQPTVATPPARTPQPPLASAAEAPTSGRWAVQLGTFSKEANAQRLVKQLRDQGQAAFVMPLKSSGGTLYRVRVGPMKDRASAEAALRELKAPGAAVVPQP